MLHILAFVARHERADWTGHERDAVWFWWFNQYRDVDRVQTTIAEMEANRSLSIEMAVNITPFSAFFEADRVVVRLNNNDDDDATGILNNLRKIAPAATVDEAAAGVMYITAPTTLALFDAFLGIMLLMYRIGQPRISWHARNLHMHVPDRDATYVMLNSPPEWTYEERRAVWRVWLNQALHVVPFDALKANLSYTTDFLFITPDKMDVPLGASNYIDPYREQHKRVSFMVVNSPSKTFAEHAAFIAALYAHMPAALLVKTTRTDHTYNIVNQSFLSTDGNTARENRDLVLYMIHYYLFTLHWKHEFDVYNYTYHLPPPALFDAHYANEPAPARIHWHHLSDDVRRDLGIVALKFMPEDVVLYITKMLDVQSMLALASTDRLHSHIILNDHVWHALFERDFGAVYEWCNKRVPLIYRGNDMFTGDQLAALRTADQEWQVQWYRFDSDLPWKRFYLHTRQRYRLMEFVRTAESHRERIRRETSSLLLDMFAVVVENNDPIRHYIPNPNVWAIVGFLFDDIAQVVDDDGDEEDLYTGVPRLLTFTTDERARLLQLVLNECAEWIVQVAPAFRDMEPAVRYNRAAQIMAWYDGRARHFHADRSLYCALSMTFLMVCMDDSRLEVILDGLHGAQRGYAGHRGQVLTHVEFAAAVVSDARYDPNICRDFMLLTERFRPHMIKRPPPIMSARLGGDARWLIEACVERMIAPRSNRGPGNAPYIL
jgi:hypothetical protein